MRVSDTSMLLSEAILVADEHDFVADKRLNFFYLPLVESPFERAFCVFLWKIVELNLRNYDKERNYYFIIGKQGEISSFLYKFTLWLNMCIIINFKVDIFVL